MELFIFFHLRILLRVRSILNANVDLEGYEENGSLEILDSIRGYFGSDSDILLLIKVFSKRAQNQVCKYEFI
jgi:hypothetical protein